MPDQRAGGETQGTEAGQVAGHAITLDSGAKVALFREVEPGCVGIVFTSAAGEETRLKLSQAALDALMLLWAPRGQAGWLRAEVAA